MIPSIAAMLRKALPSPPNYQDWLLGKDVNFRRGYCSHERIHPDGGDEQPDA